MKVTDTDNIRPKIFENSRGNKSSSIILEYIFFLIIIILTVYSVVTGKDVPYNTTNILKWIGVAVAFGVEGYKINERICDTRRESSQ
ncbi:MAG: hypothetical protein LBP39_03210 [Rickettsiales bacterium]|jgi:carbon starvation protein CstA|nr:hypothetical protein [Rickettsiales bacterium]